ncbi:MAG: hypothetical protein HY217_03780, partial [Candidatus Rokubacteria bacterium]|nr:hypothetical protein [Candidatus Rokubacteria bacterium]
RTVDLETYGLPRIVTWHAIAFALGAAWVLYWLAQPILRRSLWVASGAKDKLSAALAGYARHASISNIRRRGTNRRPPSGRTPCTS